MEKPQKEKYGWHTKCSFDVTDDMTGWLIEGGEQAYYEALKKWEQEEVTKYEGTDRTIEYPPQNKK